MLSFLHVMIMYIGCGGSTNSFSLFKVMWPSFICLYTNLFLFFAFLFCSLFFANKVELTKADLQGREGCSSPLLVWTKRCFYVTLDAFCWMQSHLWDRNRMINPSHSEELSGLKKDMAKNWGVSVNLRGLAVSVSELSIRAQVDFLKCLMIVQASNCCV